MNERFGVLRSLLAKPEGTPEWYDRVSMVLWEGHEGDPGVYFDEWVPYAASFDCWEGALMTLVDLEDFERWATIAPFGRYELEVLYDFADTEALVAFLGHPRVSTLRSFTLNDSTLGGVGRALGRASHLNGLEALALPGDGFDDAQLTHLVGAPHLRGLRSLEIQDSEVTFEGLQTLFASPHMVELQSLKLIGCMLGDLDQMLGQPSMRLPALEVLELDESGLGGDHVTELADELGVFEGLRVLSLCGNPMGEYGVGALTRNSGLGALEHLSLVMCDLDDACVGHLARSEHLANLKRLDLAANDFGEEGRAAIEASPYLSDEAKASALE